MFKKSEVKNKWGRSLKISVQLALVATLSSGIVYAEGGSDALTIRTTNNYEMIWDNTGSNSPEGASFWKPIPAEGYYLVGHHFKRGKTFPTTGTITVKDITSDSSALSVPTSFTKQWEATDSEGGFKDISLWKPNCQLGFSFIGYIAINDIYYPTSYYTEPGRTNVQNIRCINDVYLQETEPEFDELDPISSSPALVSEDMHQDAIAMYLGQLSDSFNKYIKITGQREVHQRGRLTATINNREHPVQYASLTNSQNNTRFTSESGNYEFPHFNTANIDEEYLVVNLKLPMSDYRISIPEPKINWTEKEFNLKLNNFYKVAYVAMSDVVFNGEQININPFTINFIPLEDVQEYFFGEFENELLYTKINTDINQFDIYVNPKQLDGKYGAGGLYASLIYSILTINAALEYPGGVPDSSGYTISRILEHSLDLRNIHLPDLYLPHKNRRHLCVEDLCIGESIFAVAVIGQLIGQYKANQDVKSSFDMINETHFKYQNSCENYSYDLDISNSLLEELSKNSNTSSLIQTSLKNIARNYCLQREQSEPPFEDAWRSLKTYLQIDQSGSGSETDAEIKLCFVNEEDVKTNDENNSILLLDAIGKSDDDNLDALVRALLSSELNQYLSIPAKEYLSSGMFDTPRLKIQTRKMLFSIFLKNTGDAISSLNYYAAVWGMNEASSDGNQEMVGFFQKLLKREKELQDLYLQGRSFDFNGFWAARDLNADFTDTATNEEPIAESKGLLDKRMDQIFSDELTRLAEEKGKYYGEYLYDPKFESTKRLFNESRATLIETNEADFFVDPAIYWSNVQLGETALYKYNIKLEYHDDLPVKGALILNHTDRTGIIKIDRQLSPIEMRAVLFEELGHLADLVTQGTRFQRFDMVGDEGRAFLFNILAEHFKSLSQGNGRIIPAIDGLVTPPGYIRTLGDDVLWSDIVESTSKDSKLIANDLELIANFAKSAESEDYKKIEQNGQIYTVEVQSSLSKMVDFYKTLDTSGAIDDVRNSDTIINQKENLDGEIKESQRFLATSDDVRDKASTAFKYTAELVADASTEAYNTVESSYGIRLDIPISGAASALLTPSLIGTPYHLTVNNNYTIFWSMYIDELSSASASKNPSRFAFTYRQETILDKVFCTKDRGSGSDDSSTGISSLAFTHTLETKYHFTSNLAWGEPTITSSTLSFGGTVSPFARIPKWVRTLDVSAGIGLQWSFKHDDSYKSLLSSFLHLEYIIVKRAIEKKFGSMPIQAGGVDLVNTSVFSLGGFAGVVGDRLINRDGIDSNFYGGLAVNILTVNPTHKYAPAVGIKVVIGLFNYNEDIVLR